MDESNVPSEQGSSSTISKLPFIQESAALTPQKGDRSLGVGRMSPNLVGLSTTYKISSYRTGLQCTHLTMAETEPCPRCVSFNAEGITNQAIQALFSSLYCGRHLSHQIILPFLASTDLVALLISLLLSIAASY